jgi:PAS domain S-box-containing protein
MATTANGAPEHDQILADTELLMTIAAAVAEAEDLEGILATALDHLSGVIAFTGGSIMLLEGDDLVIHAARGPFADVALGQRLARNSSPSWAVVEAGTALLSNDLRTMPWRPASTSRSYLAVPLRWRGRIFGLLEVDSTQANAFDAAHQALLQQVALVLSGPIELARQLHSLRLEVGERRRAEQRLAAQYTVTRILAEAPTFDAAAPRILQAVADHLGWEVGAVWCVDHQTNELCCTLTWQAPSTTASEFQAVSHQLRFPRGVGLPGRAWARGAPMWVADVLQEDNFPRHMVAARAGLHSAFAFPIRGRHDIFGVLEFFSHTIQPPDEDLLQTTTAIGVQIGQFIERRRAEKALQFQAQLLDVVEQAVIATDIDGMITYWNRFAEVLYGWSAAEVMDHNIMDIIPAKQVAEHAAEIMAHLRAGESWSGEFLVRHRDGSVFPAMITNSPIRDDHGGVISMVGISRDITVRKRMEEAQRFLMEASALLTASLDYQTTLQHVAQLAVPYLADWCTVDILEEDTQIHRLVVAHEDPVKVEWAHEIQRRYPPDPNAPYGVPQVLRTGQAELYSEVSDALLQAVARDAEHLEILRKLGLTSAMIVPLVARGRTLGAISFVSAESGRRYGPADLALAEDLAHRAALAIDNARLYREAQAAIQARDEFLSIASHELKTPLTALLGHAQVLQRRAMREPTISGRSQRGLATIVEQTLRLNKQITTLLDLSRIQLGQFRIERQPMDLCALVHQVVADLEPTLEHHTVHLTCTAESLIVHGDEACLEQVLQNLIQNAIKYSPQGGSIMIQVERRGAEAWIAVSDEGIGIPEAAQPHLFQRFYRASNAAPHAIKGMGIGLYLVNEIVTRHGGAVEVSSTEGKGSTFTVRLPLPAGTY